MSAKQYNLYNFEAEFKQYLLAGNISSVSIKNYLSDFRHFTGWFTFVIASEAKQSLPAGRQVNGIATSPSASRDDIFNLITIDLITNYKSYLVENNLPVKTINRRLSTIRKFCTFCISQGWMKENPGKKISNVIASKAKQSHLRSPRPFGSRDDILTQFESDLIKENYDQKIIINYLDDIREFINI